MAETVQKDERKKIFIVYAWKSQKNHRYYECTKNEENGVFSISDRQLQFAKSLFKKKTIWSIFEVEEDGTQIFFWANQYSVWYLKDTQKLSEWEASNKAVTLIETESKASKAAYEKALEPIRKAYQDALWLQRNAILADVIRFICK